MGKNDRDGNAGPVGPRCVSMSLRVLSRTVRLLGRRGHLPLSVHCVARGAFVEYAEAGSLIGRTRWRRVWIVFFPALIVVAVLVAFIAKGILAVSFAVSGAPFTITASSVNSTGTDGNGIGFYQFGVADFTGAGKPVPVAENVIPNASIANLCQSVSVGPLTLRITAGRGSTPASATNLVIDASALSASSATFTNIHIGQDMGTFTNPSLTMPVARGSGPNVQTAPVPLGTFGQTATAVSLSGVNQTAIGVSASRFTLPGLSLSFGSPC